MFVFGGNNGGIRDDYKINNSLRLRGSATGYLNRTFTDSNTSFTLSLWVKRGKLTSRQDIFSTDSSNHISFVSDDTLGIYTGNGTLRASSTAVFRDTSAWYHIVMNRNGGQAGSTSVFTVYINNQSVATYTGNGGNFTSAIVHYIGVQNSSGSNNFDGYMAEINYIDGQALTPSSFGQTHPKTGVWRPKPYTGTYGTNGFYLKFSDTSGATATTIGKDSSGNGNNWTPNNISVTSGTTYDAMIDSPTLGGTATQPASNYPTLNPLAMLSGTTLATFSEANLKVVTVSSGDSVAASTMSMTGTGKYYAEFTVGTASSYGDVGIINITHPTSTAIGNTATSYNYRSTGVKGNNSTQTSYGASYTTNDVIGVAFDVGAGTIEFYKNNTSQGVAYTGISSSESYLFAVGDELSTGTFTWTANFGQRPFTYTPPTGFQALCTSNLPNVTVPKGNKYMDATLWTGDGSAQTITNAGSFKPDFVWWKNRNSTRNNLLFDSIRGVGNYLQSNTTSAEATDAQMLTSFNSNGFTHGTSANGATNGETYVGWQWQAGQSTTSSNTDGSITSTVSANTTAGFSIVTYTGITAAGTIGHGLGVAPKMIITKSRSTGGNNWGVYHVSLGAANKLTLQSTAASTASSNWNSTTPTSSVFSVGSSNTDSNANGVTYVAYCFAEIAGFSKFGSYTGNGSTNGPFVYTGFRPRFIMSKVSSASGDSWQILDTARDTYNTAGTELYPNLSNVESSNLSRVDILSNGFKIRTTNSGYNPSGGTIIYAAFAENPFKYSLAR